MTKIGSMSGNQNHDDSAFSTKRTKTYDDGGVATWSDLNHDALLLVMMQLGVFDFLAFSGVCKSWRSFAFRNRNGYMASRTPMSMRVSSSYGKKKCHLEDFERRSFKTTLPHSSGRTCVGLTCGYLILFGEGTCDFWLVNPIIRHELHFPNVTPNVYTDTQYIMGTLVFSPSTSEWVFVISNRLFNEKIWFSVEGKGGWTRVSTCFPIHDIHAFNGKIYTLHSNKHRRKMRFLCELRLYPRPQFIILETNNILKPTFKLPEFVSAGEKLYVIDRVYGHPYKIHELDFGEMKWVSRENEREEYYFFISRSNRGSSGIRESWADHQPQYYNSDGKIVCFYEKMWYFHNNETLIFQMSNYDDMCQKNKFP